MRDREHRPDYWREIALVVQREKERREGVDVVHAPLMSGDLDQMEQRFCAACRRQHRRALQRSSRFRSRPPTRWVLVEQQVSEPEVGVEVVGMPLDHLGQHRHAALEVAMPHCLQRCEREPDALGQSRCVARRQLERGLVEPAPGQPTPRPRQSIVSECERAVGDRRALVPLGGRLRTGPSRENDSPSMNSLSARRELVVSDARRSSCGAGWPCRSTSSRNTSESTRSKKPALAPCTPMRASTGLPSLASYMAAPRCSRPEICIASPSTKYRAPRLRASRAASTGSGCSVPGR